MIKRILDFSFALLLMVVFCPIIAIVTILVLLKLGRPIIFKQQRIGLNERLFNVYKFRTMTNERDPDGNLISNAQRITPIGRMLRKTSLDELPQLWNVLNGSMSIVGPRPLLVQYIPYYTEQEHKRHHVRPGITGLAQVNGRNSLLWEDRLRLDVEYVENQSLLLDTKILAKTFLKVLFRKDVLDIPDATQGPLNVYRQNLLKKEAKA